MKKKIIAIIMAAATLFGGVGLSAYQSVEIRLNSETVPMEGILVNGVTYVPFDSSNRILSSGTAEISGTAMHMRSISAKVSVSAGVDMPYTEASERYFGSAPNIVVSERLYTPIRAITKAYNTELFWRAETSSVDLYSNNSPIESASEFYDEEDLYWLSRIISAEAGGESIEGKILVGNVVMNRVKSDEFPNSIKEVIFDTEYGVQFTPTINGTIYNHPTAESVIAAKICLDSYYISQTALYFLNPVIATNLWIPENRTYVMTVGNHDFYS